MTIEEITIKNFKSFGNNAQTLKLNTHKGELILIAGKNGSGKTTLISSIDYALFNKTRGIKKKYSTLANLPNRINNELLVKIKFISNGTEVQINRGINPNILELYENGVLNDRAGKTNIDEKIEKYVDMDLETFKSFISMSINDFKNFILLSTEEKQILLDKLFNLEIINILNNILKELNKNNKIRMATLDSEINTLNESIESIQRSIDKSIEKEKENITLEIEAIKNDMNSKKDEYLSLKEKLEKIKEKEKELSEELDKEKLQLNTTQNDIRGAQNEIDLYNLGKCPKCRTDFKTDHFLSLKSELEEKKKSLDKIRLTIETNIKNIKEKKLKIETVSENTNTTFTKITFFLKNCKDQIEKLQLKINNGVKSENIEEFKNSILELSQKKEISSEYSSLSKDKELYYKELNRIFSEDGVKKSIIAGIIKPINYFINENIKKMDLNFDVALDETFTAEIKHFGNIIEHDTLSTGELRLINVSILISYLTLIRTKKTINILFLDEVFASVDIENISKILSLLKSFAEEYKINIFVVHHAILNPEHFDRIIKIEKNIFSSIIEVDLNTLQ